ncbi:transglutaminase domain-containing protein [uncultured Aquimarina sp.]|uniref:transglutaminase domain-containing protein n=1 Tax=uncultured Aquimarina sp. TaxID=575652 RepID=UPI00262A41A5|nr:transglutaminase domain-containing protein [uncultured Aquimarina sp.]
MRTSLYIFFLVVFTNCLYAQISDFASIDFTRADNIAQLNKGVSLENLPVLAHQLTSKLPNDVEKFRAIYSWVCQNIKGDNKQFTAVNKKREKLRHDSISFMKWNHEYKKVVFKKLLKHKKTMCTGYAYLIKELCFLANIPCEIIDGYGRSVESNIKELEMANHSWNAVQLNGKWYLCDATWASGYLNEYNTFVTAYNDGYFLTDPVLFGKNHFPLEQKWLLNDNITSVDFVRAPLVYAETFENNITPMYPQNMDISVNKNDEITFSFRSANTVLDKNIALVYYVGSKEKNLKIYNTENVDDIISFTHTFTRKGFYDTHLKINGDIVATYTIKVTKS